MVTIFNGRAIKIAWTIYKGVSAVKENFDRANVVVFLIDHRGNKINVGCRQEMGTLYVDIPAGALREGIYSIEAIWAKNRDFTRPHSWEMAPWVLNHTFMDSRNIVRCLKEDLFAVTEYIREQCGVFPDEGTVVVKAKSSAATYGYDGLDAYEMSVVLGYTTLSRDEWLAQMNDPQTWFMNYLSELIRLNNLVPPNAKSYNVTTNDDEGCEIECSESVLENQPLVVTIQAHEHYLLTGVTLQIDGETITDITSDDRIEVDEEGTSATTITFTIKSVKSNVTINATSRAIGATITFAHDIDYEWQDEEGNEIETLEDVLPTDTNIVYISGQGLSDQSIGVEATSGTCNVDVGEIEDGRIPVTITNVTSSEVTLQIVFNTIAIDTTDVVGYNVLIAMDGESVFSPLAGDIAKGSTFTLRLEPDDNHSINTEDAPTYNSDGVFALQNGGYEKEFVSWEDDLVISGQAFTKLFIYDSTEGGLSVGIRYEGESTFTDLDFNQGIVKGSNFSLKLTPTANYYKVTDPAYKIGDGDFTTITPSEGAYYIEVTNIQNNIVLKGKFANETRRFYGLCNMSDDMSLINLDNATPIPSGGVTGLSTDSTHNTFFVAYQGSTPPTMSTMGITFDVSQGTTVEIDYHFKTYTVWRYTNEYGATYSDISII